MDLLNKHVDDPETLDLPESVRTPGRIWTELPDEIDTDGSGTVTVEAPDDAVEVMSLREALNTYEQQDPELLETTFFEAIDPNTDRVTALHAQQLDLADHTVFVRVPEGTLMDVPVRIDTSGENGFFPHHVVVIVEDGASAELVETNSGSAVMDSSLAEVYVGENASLDYTKINDLDSGTGYSENVAEVAENGTMNWLVLSTGSDLYKNRIKTDLQGRHSELAYDLGFLAAADQHMDITAHVIHNADHTRCDMDSRGVTLDRSRGVYKGVQEVTEDAEQTQSFQDEKTIMVGDECEADTTPQLQIDNNDVAATHAATTGHIDEEDLFYMQSRGITETDAQRAIITGMFDDLIEGGNDEGAAVIHQKIRETLGA